MNSYRMAGHLIRRLNQMSTQVFAAGMQALGQDLTPVQFAALEAISLGPGIDQAGVAAAIAYDRATIGGVIDRLVQKGLVARQVSPRDRRARELRLTETGTRVLGEVFPEVARLQADILRGLTEAERAEFLRLAAKAVAAGSEGPLTPRDT